MISCPECGQEVSDKAKKCIHCGKVLEEIPQKFCSECGKLIPGDVEVCPFCGCPVEQEKKIDIMSAQITDKVKKHKKPIIIIAAIAAVILLVNFIGSGLNEHEQLAYQNAVEMKEMMKNPDSFKLYDEMLLLEKYDENGELLYTYTIFEYGGTNGYGAMTKDEAVFKDGDYIMDYADDPDKDDNNYMEQLLTRMDLISFKMTGESDQWKLIEVDVEKIKDKMGLE